MISFELNKEILSQAWDKERIFSLSHAREKTKKISFSNTNVIVNQAEYQLACWNVSLRKAENYRVMYEADWGKTYPNDRKFIVLLRMLQHEGEVDTKQVSGLYKKWEGNQFLEQEKSILQWDMLTSQIQLNMERKIFQILKVVFV